MKAQLGNCEKPLQNNGSSPIDKDNSETSATLLKVGRLKMYLSENTHPAGIILIAVSLTLLILPVAVFVIQNPVISMTIMTQIVFQRLCFFLLRNYNRRVFLILAMIDLVIISGLACYNIYNHFEMECQLQNDFNNMTNIGKPEKASYQKLAIYYMDIHWNFMVFTHFFLLLAFGMFTSGMLKLHQMKDRKRRLKEIQEERLSEEVQDIYEDYKKLRKNTSTPEDVSATGEPEA